MASFEDYDEFGNYIGADLDSDSRMMYVWMHYVLRGREMSVVSGPEQILVIMPNR